MTDEERRKWIHAMFKSLRGYPFLPCPICGFNASCDHTVLERAQATHPGLTMDGPTYRKGASN
jgi:hypothetical protein